MPILKLGSQQIGGVGFAAATGRTTPVLVPWSRPSEWLTLPAAPTQGVSALYGVENSDGNYVAVQCTTSAGNYTVNWGDGTTDIVTGTNPAVTFQDTGDTVTLNGHALPAGTPIVFSAIVTTTGIIINTIYYVINPATNTFQLAATVGGAVLPLTTNGSGTVLSVAYHLYNYSGITDTSTSSTTLTVDGMKQCIVTIVPVSGNITVINFNVKHSRPGLVNGLGVNWLDVNVQGASLASATVCPIAFGGGTQVVNHNYLERINIGTTGVFTIMSFMFAGCKALRSITGIPSVSSVTTTAFMFYQCFLIQTIPAWSGSVANVNNMASMFQNCYSLQTIPAFPGSVANVTTFNQMFYLCFSLQTIPAFPGSVANVTTMASMFNGCNSLQTIPAFPGSVANVTTMASMFNNCTSLQTIPAFPGSVANITTMASMFNGCTSLQTIPAFPGSVANITTMASMFQGCTSLQTIPTMDLSYNIAKDRASTLTVNNWTLGTGWQYLTSPNRLDKNADGTTPTTALVPATAVTGVASTGVITATNHGFLSGDRINFTVITGGAGVLINNIYKAVVTGLNTFTLTDTLDVPVGFTTNITAGTVTRQNMAIVAATVYKVTIVVDSMSGSTATYTLGGAAGSALTAAGTYTDYITATTTAKLIITPVATGLRMTISSIKIEEVVLATTATATDYSLASSNITNMRRSISYTGCKLSRAGIVNIFNNLGTSEPAGQVIDVSANHGTPDLIIAMATLTTSTSPTINTAAAHGLAIGDYIRFSALTGPTGITTATTYKIATAGFTTTAFQLVDAATGLTPITYTGTITAGTVNRYDYGIVIAKLWTATGS